MNSTKVWFGCFILFLVVLIVISPIFLKPYILNPKFRISIGNYLVVDGSGFLSAYNFTSYDPPKHNSCYLNIPKRTVILRMDDVRAYSSPSRDLINEVLAENKSISLGVIPRDLEQDESMVRYLVGIKDNPHVEIMQHGTFHNETDQNVDEGNLIYGLNKIEDLLKVRPVTYSAPFNNLSSNSIDVLALHFRAITAASGILKEGEIVQLGDTVSNYYYSQTNNSNIEGIYEKCKASLDNQNYCVVLVHPQEFSSNINDPLVLDKDKFENFKSLLKTLDTLNASYGTFKDQVLCTENKS